MEEVSEEEEKLKEKSDESSSHSDDESELQERPSSQYMSDHQDNTIDQTLRIETLSIQDRNSFSDRNLPIKRPSSDPNDSVQSLKDLVPMVAQTLTLSQDPPLLTKRSRSISRRPHPSDLVYLNHDKKIIKEFCKKGSFKLTDVESHLLPRLQAQIGSIFELDTMTDGRVEIRCLAGNCSF